MSLKQFLYAVCDSLAEMKSGTAAAQRRRLAKRRGFEVIEGLESRAVPAPVLSSFSWVLTMGNYYTFSGSVTDGGQAAPGYEVSFGGILNGYTADVDEDGTFQLTVQLDQGGMATAQSFDWFYNASNTVQAWVPTV